MELARMLDIHHSLLHLSYIKNDEDEYIFTGLKPSQKISEIPNGSAITYIRNEPPDCPPHQKWNHSQGKCINDDAFDVTIINSMDGSTDTIRLKIGTNLYKFRNMIAKKINYPYYGLIVIDIKDIRYDDGYLGEEDNYPDPDDIESIDRHLKYNAYSISTEQIGHPIHYTIREDLM